MIRQPVETHGANALTEGRRECVEDAHGWGKPLGESFIAALRLIQFVGFLLNYGEDSIRRATAFDLVCEWMGSKFFSGLPLVLLQGLIEDRLKIWSSGGHLLTGRHGLFGELRSDESVGRKRETTTTTIPRLGTSALV